MTVSLRTWTAVFVCILGAACSRQAADQPSRASGYVEATEVRVASKVAGRVDAVAVAEGQRVAAGDLLVRLSTTDTDLALEQARADRAQADAEARLLRAGARPEDVRQAQAAVTAAGGDVRIAQTEWDAARVDEARFERLVASRAGAAKPRDDAVARRANAEARVAAARERVGMASAQLARVRAGARAEEIEAAGARVTSLDVRIKALENDRAEATVRAPAAGVISSRLVEPGELVAPRAPMLVLLDLDHAWANAYVEEARLGLVKLDQAVTVVTDGGDRLPGRVAFISPRAEFTPRNVQTADERARLVYRVKVTVDNRAGILKPGMPVEVELGGAR